MDHIGVAGWALLIFFVAVPLLTLWVYAVVDVFRRRDLSAGGVVAWLIALVLLPVVASVLYLLRRRVEERPRDMIEHVPSRVAFRAEVRSGRRRILEGLRAAGGTAGGDAGTGDRGG